MVWWTMKELCLQSEHGFEDLSKSQIARCPIERLASFDKMWWNLADILSGQPIEATSFWQTEEVRLRCIKKKCGKRVNRGILITICFVLA